MDKERFVELRNLIGYDNPRLARMLEVDLEAIEAFSCGRESIPESLAQQLEEFADWYSEAGDSGVERA